MNVVDVGFIAARVFVVFNFLMGLTTFLVWFERRLLARMQSRQGPNRWGPFGLLTSLADGIKLFFKEPIIPSGADRVTYVIAPLAILVPAFLAFAVVPFGKGVHLAGRSVPFEIADLDIGLLWVLAMGSLTVYGIVLAGWSSGSKYPLLGAIRSSAQMISYEIGMGLALIPVVMYAGTLSLRGIVEAQAGTLGPIFDGIPVLEVLGQVGRVIPRWFIWFQWPAFLIFLLAGIAETNRAPFDLPEAETELVAGYHTEYSGIKFAMFGLAEYINMITASAMAVILFFGGWNGPALGILPWAWPLVWFMAKMFFFLFTFVWIRATLPRLRYDRLMQVGWKFLIPAALVWLFISATLTVVQGAGKA